MFFARRDRPLQLSPEALRSLQLSLNTPVIRMEDLPVAPARAVLVLHTGREGQLDVTLSVRSLKTGQVLHFAPGDEMPDGASCLDAAMSFGEGMGFLFDDDELALGDTVRAYSIWAELMGDAPTQPPVAASEAPAVAEETGSLEFVEGEYADDVELLLVEAIDEASTEGATEPSDDIGAEQPVLGVDGSGAQQGVEAIGAAPAVDLGATQPEIVADGSLPDACDESVALPTPVPAPSVEPAAEAVPPPDTLALTSMVEDALAADAAPAVVEFDNAEPRNTEPDNTERATTELAQPVLTKFRSASPLAAVELEPLDSEGGVLDSTGQDPDVEDRLEVDDPSSGGSAEFALPQPVEASEGEEPAPAGSEDDTPVLHEVDSERPEAAGAPKRRRLRKAALGRLRLVKKRKPASDEDRRQWLARILSTF